MNTSNVAQRGFAAIAAIFLVVVLAVLGAFMLTFSNAAQLTSAKDVRGSRAYWAARGGLEWVIASVNATPVCPASPTTLTLDAFTVAITCVVTSHVEAGVTVKIFQFNSVAVSTGAVGSPGYVERSVSASMER
jgi:MSHA biogenesis protein MshP